MTFPPVEPGSAADLTLVAPWMASQRWYTNKKSLPQLEEIGSWNLLASDGVTRIVTHLLLDHTPGKPALYQVPLTYRTSALPGVRPIGQVGHRWVYDAPHDPEYVGALLRMLADGAETSGVATWAMGARGEGAIALDPSKASHTRVLSGEQSNTSIIVEWEDPTIVPLICKIFRAIHDGDNPDVELQGALTAAGSLAVPRGVGHVIADWRDTGQPTGRARGHLVFAQEFLPSAEDAWRVALESAAAGQDFGARARELGIATAGVHATLAARMPTRPAGPEDIAEALAQMAGRLAAAIAEVPGLARHKSALVDVLALARNAEWPAQQRIHGDLHLGQVLDVPGRGWVMVDFEGEPLRPMRERSRLDNPLRDVAGMLRSFDYVAGSLSVTSGVDAREWSATARAAFAEGYGEASGLDLTANRAVLDAFEADKALYEAVYEARNRPSWLPIPVAAIERLATRVVG